MRMKVRGVGGGGFELEAQECQKNRSDGTQLSKNVTMRRSERGYGLMDSEQ